MEDVPLGDEWSGAADNAVFFVWETAPSVPGGGNAAGKQQIPPSGRNDNDKNGKVSVSSVPSVVKDLDVFRSWSKRPDRPGHHCEPRNRGDRSRSRFSACRNRIDLGDDKYLPVQASEVVKALHPLRSAGRPVPWALRVGK